VSALLLNAFRALGPSPSWREVAGVADALHASGDRGIERLLSPQGRDRCCELADEAGANGFVALDLAVAFHNPGYFARYLEREHPSTGAVD
jgi:hypothetical protein